MTNMREYMTERHGSEPVACKAGNPRVCINGKPVSVDFRVVAEEVYKDLIYWASVGLDTRK